MELAGDWRRPGGFGGDAGGVSLTDGRIRPTPPPGSGVLLRIILQQLLIELGSFSVHEPHVPGVDVSDTKIISVTVTHTHAPAVRRYRHRSLFSPKPHDIPAPTNYCDV